MTDSIFLDTSKNLINFRIFNFNQNSQNLTINLDNLSNIPGNLINEYFQNTVTIKRINPYRSQVK